MTSYWFDPANDCFWFVPDETSTNIDHLAAVRGMLKHPEYRAGITRIWDLTGADLSGYCSSSAVQLHRGLSAISHLLQPSRIGFIVKDDLGVGIVRMVLGRFDASDNDIRIFHDAQAALDWIRAAEATCQPA